MSANKFTSPKDFKLGQWNFRFRLVFSLVILAIVIILVYLGTWQLAKATQKKSMVMDLARKTKDSAVPLSSFKNPNLATNRFSPVEIHGTYLNKYTFLLDNQVLNGQVGYRVLTALQSPHFDKWVLIDRGWIEQGVSRQILPAIRDIYGVQDIVGIINTIPTGVPLQKDKFDPEQSWPMVIQTLDFKLIEQNLHHGVYDFVVQLYPPNGATYTMPSIDFGVPSDKHFAYALQWYGFAMMVVIYYLFTSTTRNKK